MVEKDEIGKIFGDREGVSTLAEILRQLTNWAGQKNFREAVRDWGNFQKEAAGREAINIIPYGQPGFCRELLLVLSLGRNEFDMRLREAHDHCSVTCPGVTKGVLFVTDFWDNENFWDSRASTFEKLAEKYGLILAMAIWTGRSLTLEQILP